MIQQNAKTSKSLLGIFRERDLCANSDIAILSESAHIFTVNEIARNPRQAGHAIRLERRRRGWSQSVLAERAGLRQETVSLIENGNPATRIDTIMRVLAALELEFQVAPRAGDWINGLSGSAI
jgi:HTH-type transcriptional regulator/antitoxin HipB